MTSLLVESNRGVVAPWHDTAGGIAAVGTISALISGLMWKLFRMIMGAQMSQTVMDIAVMRGDLQGLHEAMNANCEEQRKMHREHQARMDALLHALANK